VTPLVFAGEVAGYLQVTVPLRRRFSDGEAELVQDLGKPGGRGLGQRSDSGAQPEAT